MCKVMPNKMSKDDINFDKWCSIKKNIHKRRRTVYARKKEIWWCALGHNIGFEQNGKNQYYERPVLVLRRFSKDLVLAVALSSVTKKRNKYYHQYTLDGNRYAVILSQLKVLSTKRLLRKQGIFPGNDFREVQGKIKNFC